LGRWNELAMVNILIKRDRAFDPGEVAESVLRERRRDRDAARERMKKRGIEVTPKPTRNDDMAAEIRDKRAFARRGKKVRVGP